MNQDEYLNHKEGREDKKNKVITRLSCLSSASRIVEAIAISRGLITKPCDLTMDMAKRFEAYAKGE